MTAMSAQSASAIDATNPFPELDLPAIRGPDTRPQPARPCGPATRRFPSPRFGDYSRTRFESRVAFGGPDEDAEDFIATPTRQFSLREITSGLPDDSREADERAAERRLRDLRGRVKAARAVVSTTPGLADVLRGDWRKAARFYARIGVTEILFRHGAPADTGESSEDSLDSARTSFDWHEEVQARRWATLTDGTIICATDTIQGPPGAWTVRACPLK
jgi:hypothetical protein